eukprot:m.29208 g.29208  ORF g.29208 m.29208 type:complete len:393 (+) comp9547_c0_seq1:458-1636(+)
MRFIVVAAVVGCFLVGSAMSQTSSPPPDTAGTFSLEVDCNGVDPLATHPLAGADDDAIAFYNNLIRKISQRCSQIEKSDFVSWETSGFADDTVTFTMANSSLATKAVRCINKHFKKNAAAGTNFMLGQSCVVSEKAALVVSPCTSVPDGTYGLTVDVTMADKRASLKNIAHGGDLKKQTDVAVTTRGPRTGKLVSAFRRLGEVLVDVCGVDECELNLWNLDEATIQNMVSTTRDNTFTIYVADFENVVEELETCIAVNKIEVEGWFTLVAGVRDLSDYFVDTSAALTNWVEIKSGITCDQACKAVDLTCNPTTTTSASIDEAVSVVDGGNSCAGSKSDLGTGFAPYGNDVADANECFYSSGDWCGDDEALVRMCCCEASGCTNTDTSTTPAP